MWDVNLIEKCSITIKEKWKAPISNLNGVMMMMIKICVRQAKEKIIRKRNFKL
jgi:hypothetical protein